MLQDISKNKDKSLLHYDNYEKNYMFNKIIMFDLDHTLIRPKKGMHPKSEDDWVHMHKADEKLKKLTDEGYKIIIISNQGGLAQGKDLRKNIIIGRIENIIKDFLKKGIKFELFISAAYDKFRKPNTGIFEDFILTEILSHRISSIQFVGDALGRKEDFSDSDRNFSYNIKVIIEVKKLDLQIIALSPGEYFLNDPKEKQYFHGFNPIRFLDYIDETYGKNPHFLKDILDNINNKYLAQEKDKLMKNKILFIMVGPPASGKSTLSNKLKKMDETIIYISQDECENKNKAKEECEKKFLKALSNNQNIILDNTHPTKASRDKFISQAKDYKTIIFYMKTFNINDDSENNEKNNEKNNENKLLYKHLNNFRMRIGGKLIPDIVINKFYKDLEEPTSDDLGIDNENNLIIVPFIPKEFGINLKDKNQLIYFIERE